MNNSERNTSAVKGYQCAGCMNGNEPAECFRKTELGGIGCGNHYSGTIILGIGKIFIGLPKGFQRLGEQSDMQPNIFETFESGWGYDKFNEPVWKFLTEDGHTLVRGLSPRTNKGFIHIFLEDCMDKISCREITQEEIDAMD